MVHPSLAPICPATQPGRLRIGLFLCAALAIFSCSNTRSPRRMEKVRVLEVVDGDSIILTDGRQVRYMCIDAPERGEHLFEEARQLNYELVYGREVEMFFGRRPIDKYGRTLAMVYLDDLFVAESLITVGLAMVYGFSDNAEFLPPLVLRQREAIDARRGRWADQMNNDEEYYLSSLTSHRFHRPDCDAAAKIKPDRRQRHDTKLKAFYAGLTPCRGCQP